MHFKHPELLFALFFLIIPVLVHLFQFRKFQQEKFTNVKFLKKASLQTRKSSRLKKWLVLCTRLLLLAAIIIAFAQPFFPASQKSLSTQETVLYLDNSYSMQAKGARGILLKRGVQELLENLPVDNEFSFFTNDAEFKNVSLNSLREELQQLTYSPTQLDWKTIELKTTNLFSEERNIHKNFIAISDFQIHKEAEEIEERENIDLHLVKLSPQNINNIAIDSAYISASTLNETELSIELRASGNVLPEVPVSVYSGEKIIGKKTVSLTEENSATTTFKLPSASFEKGIISIEDNSGLAFDNTLFFSINKTEAIKVVTISGTEGSFLRKIYQAPDFDFEAFQMNQIDFNKLSRANLIILNEPDEISLSLNGIIKKMLRENVYLIIIPSNNSNLQHYNSFFRNINLPVFQEKVEQEKLITKISFGHRLFRSVFNERVENFQYPKVKAYFKTNNNAAPVLQMENNQPFLYDQGTAFVFTAALNKENSNFQNSPLIVPTFYNIGNLSLRPSPLYFQLGKLNTIDVKANLEQDEILKLASGNSTFIPLQQRFQNKVEMQLGEAPKDAGHYEVLQDSVVLKTLSFNNDRKESLLNYRDFEAHNAGQIHASIPSVFSKIQSETDINELWKWFAIFALFFIMTEILILKYLK